MASSSGVASATAMRSRKSTTSAATPTEASRISAIGERSGFDTQYASVPMP
ncbi:hypothetical protein D3C86_1392410 [compost metagenome]